MNYSILSDETTVGERVKYFRQKRNLTQAQLAKWAGCSVGVISRLECHNSIPSADILLSICRELRVPPIYFFKTSQHISVMFMCVPGKTTFSEDDNMMNFEMICFSSDMEEDKNNCFCVLYDDKIFLADKSLHDNCDLYLCVNNLSGDAYVISSTDIDNLSFDSRVLAGLVCDITVHCSFVTI